METSDRSCPSAGDVAIHVTSTVLQNGAELAQAFYRYEFHQLRPGRDEGVYMRPGYAGTLATAHGAVIAATYDGMTVTMTDEV